MARKRVEAEDTATAANSMVRGKDGSAFARCDECKKDVPVALISMHSCSLEARIKMNLEAQIVEKPAETTKKPAERKKPTSTEPKAKKAKKDKKPNNPNKPKRPPTAFFIFLDEFRKTFKEANPDSKDVKRVAKEAGEKWKAMTDEEKKPYADKATELKAEYDKALGEVNNAENKDDEGGSEKDDAEQEVQEVPDEE
ncbi:high mobility group B protein 7 [Ricinus communis]|uniref:DNA-binding protein MNB1B, putative n=1 Tax=Ricinus communis TaxID=3988 RepID=B9RGI3_RICCO|nr:high mobility group B protein 7 [Ricinus communis]EEF49638.1 DNA-binding protein MNB1B, putative [Ricinus communis]|eukprot:XP_002513135.1 high mobility group B protein 7 [Ricinus communis]